MVHRKEILVCNPRPRLEDKQPKNKNKEILLKKIELLYKHSKINKLSNKEEIYLNHILTKTLKELNLLK